MTPGTRYLLPRPGAPSRLRSTQRDRPDLPRRGGASVAPYPTWMTGPRARAPPHPGEPWVVALPQFGQVLVEAAEVAVEINGCGHYAVLPPEHPCRFNGLAATKHGGGWLADVDAERLLD